MAKLTKPEIAALKRTMDDPGWDIIIKLLGERMAELGAKEITGSNAFETLRELHRVEGGKDSLKKFFDDLETGAYKD